MMRAYDVLVLLLGLYALRHAVRSLMTGRVEHPTDGGKYKPTERATEPRLYWFFVSAWWVAAAGLLIGAGRRLVG